MNFCVFVGDMVTPVTAPAELTVPGEAPCFTVELAD
jgi:hypothetical protein